MLSLKSFAPLALALAVSPRASAELLQSWETLSPGDSTGGTGLVVNSGSGITDGTQAARATLVNNGYQKIAEFFVSPTAATPITKFIVDWHYSGDNDGATGYFGLTAAIYNGPGTFNELKGTKSGPGGNEFIGSTAGSFTVEYILDATELAQVAANVGSGILKFEMYANKTATRGIGSTLTVDNIRTDAVAIPEPASLALMGLGVFASLSRRRQA